MSRLGASCWKAKKAPPKSAISANSRILSRRPSFFSPPASFIAASAAR